MSYVNPSGYVNPFGDQIAGEQKVAEETTQPTSNKFPNRRYSEALSPHKSTDARFGFLRRFSAVMPPSSLKPIPEGVQVTSDTSNIGVHFNKVLNIPSPDKSVEATTSSATTINNLSDVDNFKCLWALPHCRVKIREIATFKHMEENCAFLDSLTDYYELFNKKELKNIIEKHDHIVNRFLGKNAKDKIHAELQPEIEYVAIGDQTFNLGQVFTLKSKFKPVEDIVIRTLSQNLRFDPTYQVLLTTSLETARQRMLSYV